MPHVMELFIYYYFARDMALSLHDPKKLLPCKIIYFILVLMTDETVIYEALCIRAKHPSVS
jgi:hypothetical protein